MSSFCQTAGQRAGELEYHDDHAMLKLDDRDMRILSILQQEGRISKSALAKRVNLSNSPCWERLERMERAGIIEGYGARVALAKLTEHVVVFVLVELENHRSEDFELFESAIGEEPEIIGCWAIGGGFDYVLEVVTHSINSYQRLIDRLLERSVGLTRYFTYVVTKEVKSGGALPLEHLLGEHSEVGG